MILYYNMYKYRGQKRFFTILSLIDAGETMVCTEDPKRSIGLWHGVMTAAYNGIHVVFVPPNVMSTLPTAWLHMIHKHKGSTTCIVHGTPVATRTHMCNPPVHSLNTRQIIYVNYLQIVPLSTSLLVLLQPMSKFGWQSGAVCVGCGVSKCTYGRGVSLVVLSVPLRLGRIIANVHCCCRLYKLDCLSHPIHNSIHMYTREYYTSY